MWVGGSSRTNTEYHDRVCYEREGGIRYELVCVWLLIPGMWIGGSSRANTEHLSSPFRMLQQG